MLEVLRGEGPEDLRELCLELAGWMFHLGGAAESVADGKANAAALIASGNALEKFRQMVTLQDGDARAIDDPKRLPQAAHSLDVISPAAGYVTSIACEAVGTACVVLGGGREKKEDSIDPAVGSRSAPQSRRSRGGRRAALHDSLQRGGSRHAGERDAVGELSHRSGGGSS